VDAWSLGCVVLEALAGRAWFEAPWLKAYHEAEEAARDGRDHHRAISGLLDAALADITPVLKARGASAEALAFVDACLSLDASARPAAGALEAHAWVRPAAEARSTADTAPLPSLPRSPAHRRERPDSPTPEPPATTPTVPKRKLSAQLAEVLPELAALVAAGPSGPGGG